VVDPWPRPSTDRISSMRGRNLGQGISRAVCKGICQEKCISWIVHKNSTQPEDVHSQANGQGEVSPPQSGCHQPVAEGQLGSSEDH
jgi:hypothetical protein